ncbi:MAG: signal peptidase II [Oscillospiraceae bacterium]|nr:signal peptidase II [Oscillospiraceae bacterium]
MIYVLLTMSLVLLDQVVKYLVRTQIPLNTTVPFLPHIMDLTYVQNTGAAFSLFEGYTWLLTLISLAVAIALAVGIRRRIFTHPLGLLPLAVVLAGAVGNLIDRLFFGFVTDMFMTTFISFAVFNVADICVVLGGIAAVAYVYFGYDRFEKKGETGHDTPAADR